ncbi:MAG: DNA-deoxyinosine glycosylase [Parasporobacterium sp.]|nr:DNA-deoxyinosine glycosylase [Parasporobacterium sp.]
MTEQILHPIPPTYDQNSRVLILGSFPSVKSREMMYFYGHPQNRFWKVLSALFHEEVPMTVPERHAFLLKHRIAVWDSIGSCSITGSSDSSIRNVIPNDLTPILSAASIEAIYCNGRKSWEMYHRYIEPVTKVEAVCLPSTSPANAACRLDDLILSWSVILPAQDLKMN